MKLNKLNQAVNIRVTVEMKKKMDEALILLNENQADFIREAIAQHIKRSTSAIKRSK